ncbi:MAG: PEP-CTERM sorting domain-containing protein [Pontiellaceae bacterium]|nr:PEP-CTERM sorting domain-containing protein [Pontiellaceae bacterium]MBN2786179.1 PEP-CTERM sorting domain-containing protein [Pontiellaceae bacterium]
MKKLVALGVVSALSLTVNAELLHRYDFETDANDSVGTANGTISGSASIVDGGLYSGGSGINGTLVGGIPNNGVLISADAVSGITGAFTVEMWFTAPYGGPWNTAFSFSDGTTDNYVIGCPARGDSPYPSSIDAKGGGSTPSGKLALGQYADNGTLQHMLVTFDGTTLTYYQNASTDYNGFNTLHGYSASIDATGLDLSTLPIIGVNGGSPWNDNSMAGSVWDFRIYDNAVSAGQASALFALGADASNVDVIAAIPEPATFGLLGVAGISLVFARRRFRR